MVKQDISGEKPSENVENPSEGWNTLNDNSFENIHCRLRAHEFVLTACQVTHQFTHRPG